MCRPDTRLGRLFDALEAMDKITDKPIDREDEIRILARDIFGDIPYEVEAYRDLHYLQLEAGRRMRKLFNKNPEAISAYQASMRELEEFTDRVIH